MGATIEFNTEEATTVTDLGTDSRGFALVETVYWNTGAVTVDRLSKCCSSTLTYVSEGTTEEDEVLVCRSCFEEVTA